MSGIALCHRSGIMRQHGVDQQPQALGGAQRCGIESQRRDQRFVEREQPRFRSLFRLPGDGQFGKFAGELAAKGDRGKGIDAHLPRIPLAWFSQGGTGEPGNCHATGGSSDSGWTAGLLQP